MGKLTISMAIFNSKLLNYQRATTNNSWKGLTFNFLTFWFTGCLSSRTCAALFCLGKWGPRSQGCNGSGSSLRHQQRCDRYRHWYMAYKWDSHCGIYGLYGLYMGYLGYKWLYWYDKPLNGCLPDTGFFFAAKHQGRPSEMHLAVNAARRFRLIWWPSTGVIPWLGNCLKIIHSNPWRWWWWWWWWWWWCLEV